MNHQSSTYQDQLFELVQHRLALTLDEPRQAAVIAAVQKYLAQNSALAGADFVTRLNHIPTSDALWQSIVRIATIGETYFFRDLSQINALRESVLPALINKRRAEGQPYLRLWSAGCSTGEEPYTLAIMLRELLPDIDHWHISILATDLNLDNLERARLGVYRPWSFRSETPPHVQARWFTPEGEGFRIDRTISRMVTFSQLNLASGQYPIDSNGTKDLDVVICRNVLIYFDNETIARTIDRFHNALVPDGWLVLGHSESMRALGTAFVPQNFENAVLYQKAARMKPVLPASLPPPPPAAPAPRPAPLTTTGRLSTPPTQPKSPFSTSPTLRKSTGPLSTPPAQLPSRPSLTLSPAPVQLDLVEAARQAANREEWEEACKLLAEAEKKNKMRPEVHYMRSIVEVNRNQVDKALASLRKALYCDNGFVMAHYALATLYQQQKSHKQATAHFRQAQTILAREPVDALVPFGDDMTVEMLQQLIGYRLNGTSNQG